MTTFDQIKKSIKPELNALGKKMEEALDSSNSLMGSVITSCLKTKGKLIRPVIVILAAKLFGEVNDKTISSAAAVELLHNASLIHDDVVDESMIRRGKATVNSRWDNHIAVIVGDFYVSSALKQAISTGDIRIVNSLASLGRLLSLGEIDQIYNAREHLLDEKAYIEVISRKTASLFVSCVEMGAYSVGAPEANLGALRKFAEILGLCFQIKDDIFDYFDDETIGKPTGNDLREGKITLPLLYALSRKDLPENRRMKDLLKKDDLDKEDIDALIGFAKSAGGIEYARKRMAKLAEEANKALDTYPPSDARKDLKEILEFVIEREC
ncbi:MAG: polyprenyl synthetase family protein [Paramuribaculum sp.]|nr:polyprenyl synthetase family protein [Paramuribaculum sp.]